jgi:uncharacterized 2Fe-2S/4Fe-4S cluster protein (DUF4445 family)
MTVLVTIDDERVTIGEDLSLFECAERAGVQVPTSCKKNGKCRECLVEVAEGMELLSPPSPEETHLQGPFRLSCRARVAAGSGAITCRTLCRTGLGRTGLSIVDEGRARLSQPAPLDPAVTRRGTEVLLDGVRIDSTSGPLHGLAVDLGTTTVVLRLIDLETGATRGAASFENPQRFGGSDVMARIRYDTDHPGRLLQRTLLGYLGRAIEGLGSDPRSIYEVVVAGNSTMRDLFFGLDVHPIGQRPYRSVTQLELEEGRRTTTSLAVPARKLRLPVHPEARVYGLPLVHGHVGADAAACLLAAGFLEEERPVAIMDIGTNTELAVVNGGRLLVASCPAGPAFEGGLIACGMPGFEGAIESVTIDADGRAAFRTIGGGPPRGICGSGLVELLGELARTGRIDEYGRFTDESDRFVVDAARGIHLSEADISQLAQAKGANVAGLRIALARAGLAPEDLDMFYLAGGFAEHIDLDAARRIGFIPDFPDGKVTKLGNASIEGAALALISTSRRQELEEFVRTAEHVELETEEDFFDRFVDGCRFVPVGAGER